MKGLLCQAASQTRGLRRHWFTDCGFYNPDFHVVVSLKGEVTIISKSVVSGSPNVETEDHEISLTKREHIEKVFD